MDEATQSEVKQAIRQLEQTEEEEDADEIIVADVST